MNTEKKEKTKRRAYQCPTSFGVRVVHICVFLVLVWLSQLFVRLWYCVSDVLDLSLVSKRFGFWPHITHVIVLTFKEIKHLSDYRTVGLSNNRIIGQTPVNCTLCLEFRIKDTNKNNSKITSSWTKATTTLLGKSNCIVFVLKLSNSLDNFLIFSRNLCGINIYDLI
jgi:hypothetical protein